MHGLNSPFSTQKRQPPRIEPDICGILADRLETAIGDLEDKGVRISGASRLNIAVSLLRRVDRAGQFPAKVDELVRVGNALKTAFEFSQINGVLPKKKLSKPLRDTLQRAVGGSLDHTRPSSVTQAQSELRVGTILVAGGLNVAPISTSSARSPDFRVTVDTLEYNLEVKQPSRESTLIRNIKKAVYQLYDRDAQPGIIAVDMRPCISEVVGSGYYDPRTDLVKGYARRLFDEEYDFVRELATHDQRYARICALIYIAESFFWRDPPTEAYAPMVFVMQSFDDACQGLVLRQTLKLLERAVAGSQNIGGRLMRLSVGDRQVV